MSDAGRAWAEKVYREKLAAPATLPNLGPGYSNELRAARAVAAIADRKLFTRSARGGHVKTPNALSRNDRAFWMAVAIRAGELAAQAPPMPRKGLGATFDAFDLFDDTGPASAEDPVAVFFRELKHGDQFMLGTKRYTVFGRGDSVQKWVTDASTKGRKFYSAMMANDHGKPFRIEVRQVLTQEPLTLSATVHGAGVPRPV